MVFGEDMESITTIIQRLAGDTPSVTGNGNPAGAAPPAHAPPIARTIDRANFGPVFPP